MVRCIAQAVLQRLRSGLLGFETQTYYTRLTPLSKFLHLEILNLILLSLLFTLTILEPDIKWYNVKHKDPHHFGAIIDFSVLELQFYYMFLLSVLGKFCVFYRSSRNDNTTQKSFRITMEYGFYM